MKTLNGKNGELRIFRDGKWIKLPPKTFTLADLISRVEYLVKPTKLSVQRRD